MTNLRVRTSGSWVDCSTLVAAHEGGGAGGDPLAGMSRVPWDGGPNYYTVAQEGAKMTKAEAAGWSDPTFIPIATWGVQHSHSASYPPLGINTIILPSHEDGDMTAMTDEGLNVICFLGHTFPSGFDDATGEWTLANVGSNPLVVGWFIYDEPEQGEGGFWNVDVLDSPTPSTDARRVAYFTSMVAARRALADGRFIYNNFAKGVLRAGHSGGDVIDQFFDQCDAVALDLYVYTSGNVRSDVPGSPFWPVGVDPQRAATYGWTIDQMRDINGSNHKPSWGLVETKKPLLGETSASIITYNQIEGAVWSTIIHEARGILYFSPNGQYPPNIPAIDPNTGVAPDHDFWSLVDCEVGLRTKVTAINTKVLSLAQVINTQSYVFDFGAAGVDTMLKKFGTDIYIFAQPALGGSTGSKTFTLPTGITDTSVEVVGESRTVTASGGSFTDTFANEYTHHIYKVAL